LETLFPFIEKISLLLVRLGRLLFSCSSQSQAMLPSKSKLSLLLDSLFPVIQRTSLLLVRQEL
jgi:hypothetical protein